MYNERRNGNMLLESSGSMLPVNRRRRGRNIGRLWVMIVLAIIYAGLLYVRHPLAGAYRLDGSIGVLLGLYICSHPAANMFDVLFYEDSVRYLFQSRRAFGLWLVLNGLVLAAGWLVIFLGTTEFTRPA